MAFRAVRVTVGTTPTVIFDGEHVSLSNRTTVRIRNNSATNPIFLGGSNVSALTGFEIPATTTITLELSDGDPIYGVAAGATEVAVLSDRH